jgi:hypothetical protein
MSEGFCDSVESLLTFVFQQLETPQLSVDRIVDFLSESDLSVRLDGDGVTRVRAVPRRQILSVLSSSNQFVRSGPAQSQMWALRPNNPYFQTESAVAAFIDQFLTQNGPTSLDQIITASDTPTALREIYDRVLRLHSDEFHVLPDGRLWFRSSPIPTRAGFDTVGAALSWAFTIFSNGATIEELRRLLCLSINQGIPITRLEIARELAGKPDEYIQVQRGKYALAGSEGAREAAQAAKKEEAPPGPFKLEEGEDEGQPFNAESFFGGRFTFSPT